MFVSKNKTTLLMGILFLSAIISAGCIAEYDEPKVSDYAKHAAVSPVAEQGNMIVSEINSRSVDEKSIQILSSISVADEILNSGVNIESIYGVGIIDITKNVHDDPNMPSDLKLSISTTLMQKMLEKSALEEQTSDENARFSWGSSWWQCAYFIDYYRVCQSFKAYGYFDALWIGIGRCGLRNGLTIGRGKC